MPGIQCHNIIVNNVNSPCKLLLPRINLGNNLMCTPDNEDALKSNEDNYMHLVDTSIIELMCTVDKNFSYLQ